MATEKMDSRVAKLVEEIMQNNKGIEVNQVFSCHIYREIPGKTVPAYISKTTTSLQEVARALLTLLDQTGERFGRIVYRRDKQIYATY